MVVEDFASIEWKSPLKFHHICSSEDLPIDENTGSSGMFYLSDTQIAVFRFPNNQLYASQNMCGHRRAFILSESTMVRNNKGEATVNCPIHQRGFALEGQNAGRTASKFFRHTVATFEVKEEDGEIYVKLPDLAELDEVLGTQRWSKVSTPTRSKTPGKPRASPVFSRDEPSKRITCKTLESWLSW